MSDWKESAAKRRDARSIKGPDAGTPGLAKNPKDTRKWCRGKVGVEHKTKCVDYRDVKNAHVGFEYMKNWKLLICTECGKELKTYYAFGKSKPPAWVVPPSSNTTEKT